MTTQTISIEELKSAAERKRGSIITRSKNLLQAIDELQDLTAQVTQAEGPGSAYRYKSRFEIVYGVGTAIRSMLTRNKNMTNKPAPPRPANPGK